MHDECMVGTIDRARTMIRMELRRCPVKSMIRIELRRSTANPWNPW